MLMIIHLFFPWKNAMPTGQTTTTRLEFIDVSNPTWLVSCFPKLFSVPLLQSPPITYRSKCSIAYVKETYKVCMSIKLRDYLVQLSFVSNPKVHHKNLEKPQCKPDRHWALGVSIVYHPVVYIEWDWGIFNQHLDPSDLLNSNIWHPCLKQHFWQKWGLFMFGPLYFTDEGTCAQWELCLFFFSLPRNTSENQVRFILSLAPVWCW